MEFADSQNVEQSVRNISIVQEQCFLVVEPSEFRLVMCNGASKFSQDCDVYLWKDAKQCSEVTKLDCTIIHCFGLRPEYLAQSSFVMFRHCFAFLGANGHQNPVRFRHWCVWKNSAEICNAKHNPILSPVSIYCQKLH